MKKTFMIGIALVVSLMLLQLISPGARGDSNGLYLCMVEFYTIKYEGWKTTNPMMYDMVTKDGAITVQQAAKAEARKLVTGQGVIYYKCEGGVFKKLVVEKKGDGGFEMKGYDDVGDAGIREVCPGYYAKNGDPCRRGVK
ncbi:MAG: hypothetical protein JW838_00745 [Spirochaetes bacterium]|nr:hypothetical protein [Spirochaetota bacterium]